MNDALVMDDEMLERLGEYFIIFRIFERYNVSFETFVCRVRAGTWFISLVGSTKKGEIDYGSFFSE